MKKLLAIILTLVLLISSASISASALPANLNGYFDNGLAYDHSDLFTYDIRLPFGAYFFNTYYRLPTDTQRLIDALYIFPSDNKGRLMDFDYENPDDNTSLYLEFMSFFNKPNVIIFNGITYIGDGFFEYYTKTNRIYIPNSVTQISDTAFNSDNDITIVASKDSYAIEYAIEKDMDYVIVDESNIKAMTKSEIESFFRFDTYNKSVTELVREEGVFYDEESGFVCKPLDDNTVSVLAYYLYNPKTTSLTPIESNKELVIPESIAGYTVSRVEPYFGANDTFFCQLDPYLEACYLADYKNISKVTFPSTLTELGLKNCAIPEIVVPKNITSLGVFNGNINKITLTNDVKTLYVEQTTPIKFTVMNAELNESASLSFYTTVYGLENSFVHKLARECFCNFESVGIFGDVNQDGNFNGKDVLELRKSIVGLESSIDEYNSDVNFDGRINGKDVLAIRKQLVGLTEYLGEGTIGDEPIVETPSDIVETPENV